MTMNELAKLAGVSQSMISLVLNNKAEGRISPERHKMILDLARKHNFRINHAARQLRTREKKTIGIAMPAPSTHSYGMRIANLQSQLNDLKYYVVFGFWRSVKEVPNTINEVISLGVDALICWYYHPCLEKERIPIALYEQQKTNYDCVIIDYEDYTGKIIAYARKLNHRKIGYIGNCKSANQNLSFKYFLEQAPLHGLEIRKEWMQYADGKFSSGFKRFADIMECRNRPTLVIAENDIIAQGACYKANELGITIPDDVSIIGAGNWEICEFLNPKLTSYALNTDKLDAALISSILQRLDNPDSPCKITRIAGEIIERDSCRKI